MQQSDSLPLKGRVALVTGSSRGIGAAIALRLTRAGACVAINYVSDDERAEPVSYTHLDVYKRQQLDRLPQKPYDMRFSKRSHATGLLVGR